VKNVAEYVTLARAKPGTLNYGHPGKGRQASGFELFKRLAGIDVIPIGYRGYPQMVADISSGLITSTFLSANQAWRRYRPRHQNYCYDQQRPLEIFSRRATMAEQGFAEAR